MSDIVERLRGMAADYRDLVARFPAAREVIDDDGIDTIAAAADEIEQLREALDQTAGFAMSLCLAEGREAADEIIWLRGERNRLAADLAKAHREALAWMQKANQTASQSAERESPAAQEAAHG